MNAQPARAYLGIGEVLAKLRPDFPDISVSKIRFLESEGLIAPARSPSGYRKFAVADVERLRYILTAQRDQYLPLRVIRERLPAGPDDSADGTRAAALAPDAPGRATAPVAGAGAAGMQQPASRGGRLSRRELLDAAGIDDEQLAELEDFGLLRREGRQYGQHALEVARTVAELAAYGVQARHLRAVRAAAERADAPAAQPGRQGERRRGGAADRRALTAAAPRADRGRAHRSRAGGSWPARSGGVLAGDGQGCCRQGPCRQGRGGEGCAGEGRGGGRGCGGRRAGRPRVRRGERVTDRSVPRPPANGAAGGRAGRPRRGSGTIAGVR
jgi:DNA-binding transcriptional MerR regulator